MTLDGVTVSGNWQVTGDNAVTVEDGLTLHGTLSLGDSSTVGYLNFNGSQTLGGTGAVVFGSATYRTYYYGYTYYNGLFVTTAGDTLTIGPSVTVSGSLGAIGYESYQGSPGGSVINQGTIEWVNGASLLIPGSLTNDGTITVDAASTMAPGGTIVGGTIITQTGAEVGGVTLDGVTVDGNWQVVSDYSVSVLDGLTVNGILTLGDSSTVGYLNFSGSQTLGGMGTVVLGSATYRTYYGYTYYNGLFDTTSGDTLTVGPGVAVRGGLGYIGYASYQGSAGGSLINEGTIQADVSGETITINVTGVQNAGNLEVQNGATLSLQTTVDNSGTVSVDGVSFVSGGGTIAGGTLATQTGASVSNVTLDGVTVSGNWQVTGDNAVTVEDGLTLHGTLSLGDSSTVGYLNFSGSQTLGGTGAVVFGSATYRTYYYGYTYYNGLFVTTAGDTLTIGPSVTVSGSLGAIGYESYQGSSGGGVINQGTIEWVNGASLLIPGSLTNDGTITVDAASTMAPGGTIVGGTIITQTGAEVGGVTLDGVTVDGNWEVVSDYSVSVLDGLTINGTLTLGDSSTIGYLNFTGSQTLGGMGTVVFGSATYRTYYYGYTYYNGLFVTTAGDTLTIGPSVTVRGSLGAIGYATYEGSAGGSLVNEGTIQADVSGGTITINGTGDQNIGSLEAHNGATLSLQGSGNWQDGGVNYVDSTSAFSLAASFLNSGNTLALTGPGTFTSSGTIQGGTISVAVGTLLSESGTLDGATVDGNWEVVSDNAVSVLDGLTINGTLTLGDSSTVGYLNFSGSQTLGGTGAVVFGSTTYRTYYYGYTYYNGLFVTTAGDTLTIGPSVTVSGSKAYIGYASYEGSAGGNVINQGTIEWANGASISIPGTLTNDGTITVDAASTMAPGGTIVGGTIITQTGAAVGSVTLDGVTVDGNWEVVSDNSVSVLDGLTINGTLTLGDSSTIGYLNFTGSQTLGGMGTVVFGSATYRTYYYGYTYYNGLFVTNAGDTLTIGAGVTVGGGLGYIGYASYEGSAGGSVVNEGTIQADFSGETITIDGTGAQNVGNLEAQNGATLSLQTTVDNSGTVSLDGTSFLSGAGTIAGGTLATQTGASVSNVTLDGVTVSGNWQVTGDNAVTVEDGLTLHGTLSLGDSSSVGYLNFNGSQTLGGTGAVVFGSATYRTYYYGYTYYNGLFVTTAGDTLTIGPSVTVSGSLGYIGYAPYEGSAGGSLVNEGTIQADVSGGLIAMTGAGGSFLNSGIVNASAGEIIISSASFGTVNSGTVGAGPTGTLDMIGPYTQTATGIFNEVLGGSTTGLYGQTSISGTAALDGSLNISEANGFSPNTGDIFTFLSYPSESGQFANATGLVLSGSATLQPAYNLTNATLTTVTDTTIAPDLRVTNLSINPANPQSSQSVTVNWNDSNAGNGSTGGSWTDHVVVTNTTTSQTIATGDVPYNAAIKGSLAPFGTTAQSYLFNLPDGPAGVGNLEVSVTTDYDNVIAEFYPGNVGETNNTTTKSVVSTLAAYPDLQVTGLSTAPSSLQTGGAVTVSWSDANTGTAPATGSFSDYVTAVNTTTGQTLASSIVPFNEPALGPIAQGGSAPRQYTFNLPDGSPGVGQIAFTVTTDYENNIFEYNSAGTALVNNTSSITETSTIAPYPDLLVSAISLSPSSGLVSGGALTINWTDANSGNTSTPGAFVDQVVVFNTTTGQTLLNQSALYDPSASGGGPIAPSDSRNLSTSFTLPQGAAGVGDLQVTITTNVDESFFEWNSSGTGQSNNSATASISSTRAPYPDLQVTGLTVNPATPVSGGSVAITWNDANAGNAPASSSFDDHVTVTNTATGQVVASGDVNFDASATGSGPIAAGSSAASAFNFTLPNGTPGIGSLSVTVTTDYDNQVFEDNAAGTAESNNTATVTFTSIAAPYPDLQVAGLAIETSSVQSGDTMTITWNDANTGNGPVNGAFVDSIAIVNTTTGQTVASSTVPYDESSSGAILPGLAAAEEATLRLPDGPAGVGQFSVVVSTDSAGQIFEYNADGTAESNNASSVDFTSTLAPYPDLQVSNLSVSPSAPESGQSLTITWDDENTGLAPVTARFSDRVVVSNLTTGAPVADALLPYDSTATGNAPIDAGASLPRQFVLNLPDGSAGVGQIQITVQTNSGYQIFEYNASGSGESNNTSTVTVGSVLASYPDLAVSGVVAPVSVVPGQQMNVTWTVSNVGNAPISAPWDEEVLLASDAAGDNATLLNDQIDSDPLAPAQSTTRSLTVQVPSMIAGNYWLVVSENANGQLYELNPANDIAIASQPTNIAVTLSLAPASSAIAQNASPATLAVTIARTGDASSDLFVNLSSDDPADLSVPAAVTIPAGQSSVVFDATVHDSGIADANQLVHLSASAAGSVGASSAVTVLDTDQPSLQVTLPSQLTEGQSSSFTVTRGGDTSQSVVVQLSDSLPSQLIVPNTVTIPAGQSSVTAMLNSIDDGLPEKPQSVSIAAMASGLVPATAPLVFLSNNLPILSLTPNTNNVLESAGTTGITLVVQRQKVTIGPLTVKLYLSDTTLGTLPGTVVIPANAASTSFTFLPIDDHLADGPHTEVVTAYGAYASCGCTIVSGSASATITIVNDNQPSLELGLSRSLIFKSDTNPAAMGTVFRPGGDTSSSLIVALSSSDLTEASVPSSVTIPAGAMSATFPITAVPGGNEHGNQIVSISANATGFAAATSSLTVTDVDLPQLVVTQIEPSSSSVASDNSISVSFTITNEGQAAATGTWQQQVYLSDNAQGTDATLVGTYSLTATLNPGDSFSRSVPVTAPDTPGNYWLVVADDVDNQIAQATGGNNISVSDQPIQVTAVYTATVSTNVSIAPIGTQVPLFGTAAVVATGAPAEFKLVDVHIDVNGIDRVISAVTDASGNFNLTFTPLPNEAGVYTFFAAHPGVTTGRPQGEFSLVGISANPAEPAATLIPLASAVSGQITLNNLADVPLTNVTAVVSSGPADVLVTLTLGDGTAGQMLSGNGSLTLAYAISADAAAVAGTSTVTVRVSTDQGATLEFPIDVTVKSLTPQLTTNPGTLYSGMVVGSQTLATFTVTNNGGAATGPLTVLLPQNAPWLALASSVSLPSLQPGDTQTITLQLTPDPSLALTDYTGTLVVAGTAAGADITVPFTFRAISSAVGDLSIDAQDEYTYFASGSPHVASAQVTISDAVDGSVVSTGTTGDDGTLLISSLPAGYYTITVTAAAHNQFTGAALVGAGATTYVTAFLPRQTVTETWTVTPTQIQDQTQVSLNVTFDTDVPVPVVTVTPGSIDLSSLTTVGQTMVVDLTITNHGLIAAQDLTLSFPSHPFYTFTPLVSQVDSLPAESSLTIPLMITKVGGLGFGDGPPGGSPGDGSPGSGTPGNGSDTGGNGTSGGNQQPDCVELSAGWVSYKYECGPNNIVRQVPIYFQHAVEICATPVVPVGPPPPPPTSVSGPPPISRPSGPSGGTGNPGNPGGPGGPGNPGTSGTPAGPVVVSAAPPPVVGAACSDTGPDCKLGSITATLGLNTESSLANKLGDLLKQVPFLNVLEKPQVSVGGSFELSLCCNYSIGVSAKAQITGSTGFTIPLLGATIDNIYLYDGYSIQYIYDLSAPPGHGRGQSVWPGRMVKGLQRGNKLECRAWGRWSDRPRSGRQV